MSSRGWKIPVERFIKELTIGDTMDMESPYEFRFPRVYYDSEEWLIILREDGLKFGPNSR